MTNSHPAIIDPKEWDHVAKELRRRKSTSKDRFTGSIFVGKVFCGDCGKAFGPKVWHSNDPYRKVIWQCNAKFKNKNKKCSTPHLTEEQIKDAYITALKLLIVNRGQLVEDVKILKTELADTCIIEKQIAKVNQEMDVVSGLIIGCIEDNASSARNQEEYNKHYDSLVERYENHKSHFEQLLEEKNARDFKPMY